MDYRFDKPQLGQGCHRGEDYIQGFFSEDEREDFNRTKGIIPEKLETMSGWIQRQIHSPYVQLAGVAVLSGAAVAGAIFGYQSMKRQAAVQKLKASIPELDEQYTTQKV